MPHLEYTTMRVQETERVYPCNPYTFLCDNLVHNKNKRIFVHVDLYNCYKAFEKRWGTFGHPSFWATGFSLRHIHLESRHHDDVFAWTGIITKPQRRRPRKQPASDIPMGAFNPGFNNYCPNENWFRTHNCNYAYNACPSQLFSGLVFGQMLMLFHV